MINFFISIIYFIRISKMCSDNDLLIIDPNDWLKKEQYLAFCRNVKKWNDSMKDFLSMLFARNYQYQFLSFVWDDVWNLQINSDESVEQMKDIFEFLFSNIRIVFSKNQFKVPLFIMVKQFELYMYKLSSDVDLYEKVYLGILNYLNYHNALYPVVLYAYVFLNFFFEECIWDPDMVDEVLNFQEKLWKDFVKKMKNATEVVFRDNLQNNTIHNSYKWDRIFEFWKKLGRISSKEIFDYFKYNNLFSWFNDAVEKYLEGVDLSTNENSYRLRKAFSRFFDKNEIEQVLWLINHKELKFMFR